MRTVRIILGSLVLVALAASVVLGVWVLREHTGGGLPVEVAFDDISSLAPRAHVFYGDQQVGRVEHIKRANTGYVVRVRIAAEHASLVRERSRFWIEDHWQITLLRFDRTSDAGPQAQPGATFSGLAQPPDPDPALMPPPAARPLRVRPVWTCVVRATVASRVGRDEVLERSRRAAGAVVEVRTDGDLLILTPAWVVEPQGELIARAVRVEIIGEGVRLAEVLAVHERHAVLYVPATEYRQPPAQLWPHELGPDQVLVLASAEGSGRTAVYTGGQLQFRAVLGQGHVALIEGTRLAGFAVPPVGADTGAEWVSLHGAGTLIDHAAALLNQ
jgi:hypothetical protein